MALKKSTIQELQLIMKEDYGKDITLAEADKIAVNLLGYFDVLYRVSLRKAQLAGKNKK